MKAINFKYYTFLLVISLLACSCQKVINLELRDETGQLVIEGNFTDERGAQYVKLSRNVPFTNTNTYPAVSGATVTIDNNNGRHFQLTEGPEGTYFVNPATGVAGRNYTLTVVAGGKTYTASSIMPAKVKLDSITFKENFFDSSNKKRLVTVHFVDPVNQPNYYRFVLYVNKVQVKTIFAFDDQFIDGRHVDLDLQENDIDIYPLDTVEVEMQCLDKPIFTYWYAQAAQQPNNPGGAVAPANPTNNITPVTLGYFSAHTTQSIIRTVP
jgi:hypothetical protein